MGFTQEDRSKGGRNGKPGKHTRTKQWEALAEKFTGEYADRVIAYLDTLKDEELFEAYKDLLNYFRPRLQSTRVDMDAPLAEVNVNLSKEDVKKIIDKL